ncbi:GGDEF domain-containing protein [Pseudofrankia sp. BMG5.37]|uniref:GGDEF domain-containing protein n=1 Tax=Pseudofrankia sp. BMG5.37 TaxID=3050035 RepID=UPI002893FDEE|nr:GGDEF domain-containing protein [Pseudofrankia sp. BMG5.37]MDT3446345.1 GGDEF domain-containing protein [Pseudofrankia sp. BMG5.37]
MSGQHAHDVVCGRNRWYDVDLVPMPGAGRPAAAWGPAVAGVVNDVTEREEAIRALRVRTARQAALADLAQHALESTDESSLCERAARILEDQLPTDEVVLLRRAPECPNGSSLQPDWDGPHHPTETAEPSAWAAPTVARVPVGRADAPVATLVIRDRSGFNADGLAFIRSVAAVVGAAVMRIRSENDARYRAWHDPLTGLVNRAALLERLSSSLRRACADRRLVGVLFLDLDGFKAVNDTLGHQAGDDLLRTIADRLLQVVRPQDVVGRLAGDEFAVLCDDLGLDDLCAVGHRVLGALAEPVTLRRKVRVGGSVGIALSSPDLADPEELLNAAGMAMYQAKKSGPGRCVAYDERIRATLANAGESC